MSNQTTTKQLPPDTEVIQMEFVRYPSLVTMIVVLRILALVFILAGLVIGFLQIFDYTETYLIRFAHMLLYAFLGFFQGLVAWVLSEAIKVWVDTEYQTRPKEVNDRIKELIAAAEAQSAQSATPVSAPAAPAEQLNQTPNQTPNVQQ